MPLQLPLRDYYNTTHDMVGTRRIRAAMAIASAQYWPSSGIAQYGEYIVDLLGEAKLEGFNIRNLSVIDIEVHRYV